MKISILAFLLVLAGTYSLPTKEIDTRQEHAVNLESFLAVMQIIRELFRAHDPFVVNSAVHTYRPIPTFLELEVFINNLGVAGFGDFVIDRVRYTPLLGSVTFDAIFPEISVSILSSGFDSTIFGNKRNGRLHGTIAMKRLGVSGDIRSSALSIEELSLRIIPGTIEANVRLDVLGTDYSNEANAYLNIILPEVLRLYQIPLLGKGSLIKEKYLNIIYPQVHCVLVDIQVSESLPIHAGFLTNQISNFVETFIKWILGMPVKHIL